MNPASPGAGPPGVGHHLIRPLNVVVAWVLTLLALPVMAVIAVAVKATSRGPALYRQRRVGHDRRRPESDAPDAFTPEHERRSVDAGGRIFTMLKFRTMRDRGPTATPEVWAAPDDPRITTVGALLRQHRLDELPQLFNVIRGDMNVVGPRPEQPDLFRELDATVPGYGERQAVPPGITGWAQVNHGYDRTIEDVRRKVELDLEYIRRRSLADDLGIMARTLPVMIGRRGAL